jgi:tRNA (guanine37-N1)-methyltransferase
MVKGKFRAFEFIGNIALVNFPRNYKAKDKKKYAQQVLKRHKSVKTVLEKTGRIKGRLRKVATRYLAGEKTKEVLYRENDCVFRFNLDKTFFSARLSNERKEIAGSIKQGEEVLVMFAGVAPYSIVIAKKSGAKVYSNEINREANKYAKLNVELNNLKSRIVFVNGDIKKVAPKLKKQGKKFSVIVMPRPQLKDTFLKEAFVLSRKGTRVYYYDFCKADEIDKIKEKVKSEAKKYKKKIKILRAKKAGDIAPFKYRVRVDFRVL